VHIRLALVLLVATILAGPKPRAHAIGEGLGWTAPIWLSDDGVTALAPSLGLLADDGVVAAWAESTPGGWFPVMASKAVTGNWSEALAVSDGPIDAPGTYSFGPRFGWAANGSWVGTWLVHRDQQKGDGTIVNQAVVEGATGSISSGASPGAYTSQFFAGRHPPNGYTYSNTPRVIMTPDGNGVVAYRYQTCCGSEYTGLTGIDHTAPTGSPGDPQTSIQSVYEGGTNDDFNPTNSSIAGAGRGIAWDVPSNATLALIRTRLGYVTNPYAAELITTTTPSSWPTEGTTLPFPGFGASAGVLSDGSVVVASINGGVLKLWRTGFGSATTIDPDVGVTTQATIATSWDGQATIAYMADDDENGVFRIRVITVNGVGGVTGPVTVSNPDGVARNPAVAYAPDGTVHVVWSQGGGTIGAETGGPSAGVFATYRLPDGDFPATATPVIRNVAAAHVPKIVVSKDGFATVVAQVNDGTRWRIAAFTHANPAVPENVTPPAISFEGVLGQGTQLVCDEGTWTANPTSYAFEWLVDGTPQGPASPDPTHAVAPAEVGHAIVCRVTASNTAGSGRAESAAVSPGGPSSGLTLDPTATISPDGKSATLNGNASGPGNLDAGSPSTGTLIHVENVDAAKKKPRVTPPVLDPASVRVEVAGPVQITVALSKTGKKQLKKKKKKGLSVPVQLRFTPDGGTPDVQTVEVLFKKPKKTK
jgi:hypothetical protein